MQIKDIINLNEIQLSKREMKASQELEAYFIHFMLREMRKTIPKSDLFGKSFAEDIYVDILDQQIAMNIAVGGGIGLSRQIEKSFALREQAINGYEEVENLAKS